MNEENIEKLREAIRLDTELKESLNEVRRILGEVLTAYIKIKEAETGEKTAADFRQFFIEEIKNICDQSGEGLSYTDFVFALSFDKEKDRFTPRAIELQSFLNHAYSRADERIKNGERIIEERAADEPREISTQVLESMSKIVKDYYFPNDKTANSLEKMIIDGTQYPLGEEPDGSVKKVSTYIAFDFDEAAKETDLKEFTLTFSEFDKQVQESVVSLMKAGNKIITPSMIHKTLTGNAVGARITPNWENDINRSMKKFNSVFVTADLSETAKMYPALKDIEKLVKGTRLMQFEKTYVKTKNGNEVLAYEMLKEPVLYTIADAKKQVGHFEIKRLENGKTSNSIDHTELKIYLLKRINAMSRKMNPSILFETLYNVLGKETTKEKRTTRENAEKLLKQFVADHIISDFKIENKGKSPVRINITLNQVKK